MNEMKLFCESYFDTELPCGGQIADSIPNILNLKYGLLRISTIFNGTENQPGLRYYLSTPKKWDDIDILNFENTVSEYIKEIKRSLWRVPGTISKEEPWRKPWIMPKLHALVVHVKDVVEKYGYYGIFSEEGMEHVQQVSKATRNLHSPNKSLGAQIVDDMQYNAVLSSPRAKTLRRTAEQRCIENGRPVKKVRYG